MSNLHIISGTAKRERLSARLAEVKAEVRRMERQLVDDDLTVSAGPRKGKPLMRRGRSQWLNRLRWHWSEAARLDARIRGLEERLSRSQQGDSGEHPGIQPILSRLLASAEHESRDPDPFPLARWAKIAVGLRSVIDLGVALLLVDALEDIPSREARREAIERLAEHC